MNELVFIQNDQALTTSLKVAEVFEKRHDNVIQAIEKALASLLNFKDAKKAFVKSSYVDAQGKERPMYYLNRDGFSFTVMSFTGNKAAQWKWNYIQAFNQIEKILVALLTERNSEEWKEARQAVKLSSKKLADTIQKILLPYIRANGYQHADELIYMQFNRMINKILRIAGDGRDTLTRRQLCELETLNNMTAIHIERLVQKNLERHEIYHRVKRTLNVYAEISCLSERLNDADESLRLN